MSLFVTHENQKLLWQIINNNEMINRYFESNPYVNRENWFKTIIQKFYEKNRFRLLSQTQLYELNKEVLAYISKSIKEQAQPKIQTPPQEDTNFLKPYSVTESKVEKIGNRYAEKQNEYNSLFDRKKPEDIDFREKNEDKPLANMDELIKNTNIKYFLEKMLKFLKNSFVFILLYNKY
jgi:hypothetical protein